MSPEAVARSVSEWFHFTSKTPLSCGWRVVRCGSGKTSVRRMRKRGLEGTIPKSQSRRLVVFKMCKDPCSVAIARRGVPPFLAPVRRDYWIQSRREEDILTVGICACIWRRQVGVRSNRIAFEYIRLV
jgi:hypothetical protein